MVQFLLFAIFPYIAITTFIVGSLYRFYNDRYSISSQSSQFLGDKNSLLFGSYSWHWAITLILTMHFIGIFFLGIFKAMLTDNATIVNIWEYMGMTFASFAIIGITVLIIRRLRNPRLRVVTTKIDWLTFILLLIQVSFGLWVAYSSLVIDGVPGSSWFGTTIVPWLWSLMTFNPVIGGITTMSWDRQLHFVNGMVLLFIFPFSRLSHMLSYPYYYAYRRYQIVIWNNKVKRRTKVTAFSKVEEEEISHTKMEQDQTV